jgi:hypothetical protein
MQIGIDSFVINQTDQAASGAISTAERMSNLLAEIECAVTRGSTSSGSVNTIGLTSRIQRLR